MNAMKYTALAAVAVCALALSVPASTKNPVTRPLKIQGNCTLVVDLLSGAYELTEWGEATHGGRYSNTGSGLMVNGIMVSGSGTSVMADGSNLDWHFVGPLHAIFENGTRRLEGATGWQKATITWQGNPVFNGDGTMILQFTYVGIGEITF